jgi:trans-aconitate 2-methyltransferase
MAWDVAVYERFAGERARPFLDLVARVPDGPVASVVDLGCGTGELTRLLLDRWPAAFVLGIDNSAAMLAAARPRALAGRLAFEAGDAGRFQPATPVDRLISNAVLHWVPDHDALIPRLAGAVAPGGVLAVQMPANFDAPSHQLMRAVAADGPWAPKLARVIAAEPVRPLGFYVETLCGLGLAVDGWETTYLHQLAGPDPVLGWVRGTALRPVLDALDPDESAAFVARYGAELRAAYPPGRHGTLFPFRRIFFVARRPA